MRTPVILTAVAIYIGTALAAPIVQKRAGSYPSTLDRRDLGDIHAPRQPTLVARSGNTMAVPEGDLHLHSRSVINGRSLNSQDTDINRRALDPAKVAKGLRMFKKLLKSGKLQKFGRKRLRKGRKGRGHSGNGRSKSRSRKSWREKDSSRRRKGHHTKASQKSDRNRKETVAVVVQNVANSVAAPQAVDQTSTAPVEKVPSPQQAPPVTDAAAASSQTPLIAAPVPDPASAQPSSSQAQTNAGTPPTAPPTNPPASVGAPGGQSNAPIAPVSVV